MCLLFLLPLLSLLQDPVHGRGLRHKKPSQRLMEGLQVLLAGEVGLEGVGSEVGDAAWWAPGQGGADQGSGGQVGCALGLPQQLADLHLPSSASQQEPHAHVGSGVPAEQAAVSGSWGQAEDAAWMLTVPGAVRKRPRNWVPLPPAAEEPCTSHTSGSSGYGPPLFKAAPSIVQPVVGLQHVGGSSQHYPVLEVAPLHCSLGAVASLGPPLVGAGTGSIGSTYLPASSSCIQGLSSLPPYDFPSPASSSWAEYGYVSDSQSSQDGSSQSSEGSTRMVKRCRTAGPSRLRASSS
jgi:hypothetical protein